MKIFRHTAAAVALGLLVGACEESFNPKATFEDVPVLYGVFRTNVQAHPPPPQTIVLTSTYDVEGLDPDANTVDPAIQGARIVVRIRQREYLFAETTAVRRDTSRYTTPLRYYTAPAVAITPGDSLFLTAVLPGGQVLTARTAAPPTRGLEVFPKFPRSGFTTLIDPLAIGTQMLITWDDRRSEDHLFFPDLFIRYTFDAESVQTSGAMRVPLKIMQGPGGPERIYPSYQTEKQCVYDFAAVDQAMRDISGDDPEKQRYRILTMTFGFQEFDLHLSRYYASVNGFLDQYSVRLDETIYTNVKGGFGVFGVATTLSYAIPIDPTYIESFGYRP